jgi:hypothetical protein
MVCWCKFQRQALAQVRNLCRERAEEHSSSNALKQKSPDISIKASFVKERQRLTLPGVIPVPSALVGLTALFGMGRGDPHRHSHLKVFSKIQLIIAV